MRITIMNTQRLRRLRARLSRKLCSTRGLTLTELLVTTVIVLLVSACMVTGISLANRQFVISMRTSESRSLYSTLANVVQGELRMATRARFSSASQDNAHDLIDFFSTNYAIEYTSASASGSELSEFLVVDDDGALTSGYGYLALGSSTYGEWKELISSASYTYGMGAQIAVTGHKKTVGETDLVDYYHVELSIGDKSDASKTYTSGEFDVVPLNDVGFTTV